MNHLVAAAKEVTAVLRSIDARFAFIGGLAVLVHGEVRATRDVDLSVSVRDEGLSDLCHLLLQSFASRVENPLSFAQQNRVLLLSTREGVGIDIALTLFDFEDAFIQRAKNVDVGGFGTLPVITAEDLICMKVFAGREIDFSDVRGIIVRQGTSLDWDRLDQFLPELLSLKDDLSGLSKFREIKTQLGY